MDQNSQSTVMINIKLKNSLALLKGCRMGRSDKVSLWYVALSINNI